MTKKEKIRELALIKTAIQDLLAMCEDMKGKQPSLAENISTSLKEGEFENMVIDAIDNCLTEEEVDFCHELFCSERYKRYEALMDKIHDTGIEAGAKWKALVNNRAFPDKNSLLQNLISYLVDQGEERSDIRGAVLTLKPGEKIEDKIKEFARDPKKFGVDSDPIPEESIRYSAPEECVNPDCPEHGQNAQKGLSAFG